MSGSSISHGSSFAGGKNIRGYRPDVDGLRAVAVMSVVGFHFFPKYFPGGFVGVDVFFVISGFLISGIILDGLTENSFSFRTFYARRIRRLFPALILVLACTLAIGWLVLFPVELRALGKHTAGGAGFIANILYWRESGYFDAEAATKPLLHLWSLGIEEQFYIVFPLLLCWLWKKGFRQSVFMALLLAASLAYNLHLEHKDHVADFYSPLARFWELLTGAVLACLSRTPADFPLRRLTLKINDLLAGLIYKNPDSISRLLRHLLSALGLITVTLAVFTFRERPTWPGHWAITPVVGAALILAAGQNSFSNHRILGNPLAVGIGLISYPLYLWHWPIAAYLRILSGGQPDRYHRILGVLAAMVLAWLTYKLVEKPFRFGLRCKALKTLVLASLLVVVAGIGACLYARTNVSEFTISAADAHKATDAFQAYTGINKADFSNPPVEFYGYFSGGHGPTTIAMIGDSHVDMPYYAVANYNAAIGLNTLGMRNPHGMPLLFGAEENGIRKIYNDKIKKLYKKLFDRSFEVLARPEIKYVVIFLFPPNAMNNRVPLQATIDKLTGIGKKVFLVTGWPVLPRSGADYAYTRPYSEFFNRRSGAHRQELDRKRLREDHREYFLLLSSMKNVTVIDETWDAFCPNSECLVFSEAGTLLYTDFTHLSAAGSELLVKKVLAPYLTEMAKP